MKTSYLTVVRLVVVGVVLVALLQSCGEKPKATKPKETLRKDEWGSYSSDGDKGSGWVIGLFNYGDDTSSDTPYVAIAFEDPPLSSPAIEIWCQKVSEKMMARGGVHGDYGVLREILLSSGEDLKSFGASKIEAKFPRDPSITPIVLYEKK